jgi:hypothetical protein
MNSNRIGLVCLTEALEGLFDETSVAAWFASSGTTGPSAALRLRMTIHRMSDTKNKPDVEHLLQGLE